ncbi:DMT family transporter [Castellaniella sp.]|uniref:DMT family transporter n=1 Tax=Castellaniella sp. TaxID=1955812 RepID=UPI00356002C8
MKHFQVSWITGSQVLVGALFLVGAQFALSSLDASGKYLMGVDIALPLLTLCLVRYGVHMLLALALVIPAKGWRAVRCKRPGAQLLRGLSMLAATMSFFTTLHYLPLAQATAINFLAPLLVLAVAPWILKERIYLSRWVACSIGLLGVLVVIRPGSGLSTEGTLYGLLTACIMAVQYITSRKVAADDPYTTLIWSGTVGTVLLLLGLPLYWDMAVQALARLSAWQWLVLLGTGFWGCLGHYLQIQAYWHAPASLLSPFIYLQIVSATTLGWLVWGDIPDMVTWVGILVVCASGMTIGLIEWRRK